MLQHYHLPPPCWFFMGQLNPESYLLLGLAKFVCKIFLQTESKYVFVNLHILYNGTIYGIYWLPGKLTSNRASWNYAKFAHPPPLPPGKCFPKSYVNHCCLTDNVSWCVLREDMLRLPITCCCFLFFKLLGFSRVGTIHRCINLATLTNLNKEICICHTKFVIVMIHSREMTSILGQWRLMLLTT